MQHILVLCEGDQPPGLRDASRWPGVRVSVLTGLSESDLVRHLGGSEAPDAVVVNTGARCPALTAALDALPCPSAEVMEANPYRDPDGAPNFDAVPAGADAIVFGLGEAGCEIAVSLLAARLGPAEQ